MIHRWATSGTTTSLRTAFITLDLPSAHSWEWREQGELLNWGYTPPTADLVSAGSVSYLGQAGTDSAGTYAQRVELRTHDVRAFALLDVVYTYPANWSVCTEDETASWATCDVDAASYATCADGSAPSYVTCAEPSTSFVTCSDVSASLTTLLEAAAASYSTCDEESASWGTCGNAT